MSILTIIIMAVVAIVVLVIAGLVAGFLIINFDLMSYTATSSESLSPTGTVAGNALVVYSPGLSGAAKATATEIAADLKAKGYKVELAGIRSPAAANVSSYNVVIVGGPIYFGSSSSGVATYLKGLTLAQNSKLGVFGTTGTGSFVASDLASTEKQVETLQSGKKAVVKLIGDKDQNNATKSCQDFVSAMV